MNKMLQMVSIRDYTHGPTRAAAKDETSTEASNKSCLLTSEVASERGRRLMTVVFLFALGHSTALGLLMGVEKVALVSILEVSNDVDTQYSTHVIYRLNSKSSSEITHGHGIGNVHVIAHGNICAEIVPCPGKGDFFMHPVNMNKIYVHVLYTMFWVIDEQNACILSRVKHWKNNALDLH